MAKVAAAPGDLPSNPISCGGGGGSLMAGSGVRRKTPSELRGEQLKRRNVVELVGESLTPSLGSTGEVKDGLKKSEPSKNPRYADTRMNELYPVKKSRFQVLPGKDNDTKHPEDTPSGQSSSLKSLSIFTNLAAKRRNQLSSGNTKNSMASAEVVNGVMGEARHTIQKCSQNTFRNVAELSSSGEKISGFVNVDMDKVLKGLVSRQLPSIPTNSSETFGDPASNYTGNMCSECHIAGQNVPLDFTLKTSMRVVSTSSVNWFRRMSICGTPNGLLQSTTANTCNFRSLHSWVYPQSSLPPSLISVMKLSTEGAETDFLRKRQLAWEDSFRSLFYMLRKSVCALFYVCTSQFVVMFTATGSSRRSKRSCNAYISQSTKGLRSSLKEHDISFSMPLCRSKVEQVTSEDLAELSEIEKNNLGQTRQRNSVSDVDNSPQSLLAFVGNESMQGLYDFMLNYRSSLTSLISDDVPVLYSPVPFQNAALSSPEIRCMEMKRADLVDTPKGGSSARGGESIQASSPALLCSIEIKDAYLPPWIICGICALIRPEGNGFEASFTTEATSIGLNVALETDCEKSDDPESAQKDKHSFGIPEAIVTPQLRMGLLKGLKYLDGSYTASLSPV